METLFSYFNRGKGFSYPCMFRKDMAANKEKFILNLNLLFREFLLKLHRAILLGKRPLSGFL